MVVISMLAFRLLALFIKIIFSYYICSLGAAATFHHLGHLIVTVYLKILTHTAALPVFMKHNNLVNLSESVTKPPSPSSPGKSTELMEGDINEHEETC